MKKTKNDTDLVSIWIEKDMRDKLKIIAATNGKKMWEILNEALLNYGGK